MYGNEWKATLQAAVALDEDHFTICLGELEYDDPFTAIISYDGQFPQPWSRTDVRREIVDVAYMDIGGSDGIVPVALSNEGDVYGWVEMPPELLERDFKGLPSRER